MHTKFPGPQQIVAQPRPSGQGSPSQVGTTCGVQVVSSSVAQTALFPIETQSPPEQTWSDPPDSQLLAVGQDTKHSPSAQTSPSSQG